MRPPNLVLVIELEGYRGITLLRSGLREEVEFVTIMDFDKIEDVIVFQGEDYEQCHVPDAARRVLKRWDDRSAQQRRRTRTKHETEELFWICNAMTHPTSFRRALMPDLAAIVALLADDPLGRRREVAGTPVHPDYVAAFEAISRDTSELLAVADRGGEVVGCLQISFLPGLSRRGLLRGQIESVRVASHARGEGLGRRMLEWAIETCRERGCGLVQLTTDRSRPSALRFYEELGFLASHIGCKLEI